jgi:hypothetical protein
MKRLKGKRLKAAEMLELHHHICDLIYLDFPVLSLYTDGRNNWIYLWVDTDEVQKDRWLLFTISRDLLARYLAKKETMRTAVMRADPLWVLETRRIEAEPTSKGRNQTPRRYLREVTKREVSAYVPSAKSYFDPRLTDQLDLTRQVVPAPFDIPLKGLWFGVDFQTLFKRYERLYAFFYATTPTFVKTAADRLKELLHSPWTGGFSRVNLFSYLPQEVPGIHALQINEVEFASPGKVTFEAIPQIGRTVGDSIVRYLANEVAIDELSKSVNRKLNGTGLRKRDTSSLSDGSLSVEEKTLGELRAECGQIARLLCIETEIGVLRQHSPNTVVYSKAVLSLLTQLSKVAALQRAKMLSFRLPKTKT